MQAVTLFSTFTTQWRGFLWAVLLVSFLLGGCAATGNSDTASLPDATAQQDSAALSSQQSSHSAAQQSQMSPNGMALSSQHSSGVSSASQTSAGTASGDIATASVTGADEAATAGVTQQYAGPVVPYAVQFGGDVPEDLLKALQDASLLQRLLKNPPDDMTGLMVRITADEAEAVRILHAYGYYEGQVTRAVDTSARPVRVSLTLVPGPQYTVGTSRIYYKESADGASVPLCREGAASVPQTGSEGSDPTRPPAAPCTLADVGLNAGAPAKAGDVLDAVDKVPVVLAQRGYPLARLLSSRYTAHKGDKTLTAEVVVTPGPRARMGKVRMEGKSRVKAVYVEGLRQWEVGHYWDQREVDSYRDMLTALGLFRSVRVEYIPADQPTPPAPDADMPTGTSRMSDASTKEQLQGATSQPALADATTVRPVSLPADGQMHPAAVQSAGDGQPPLYDVILYVADAPQRTVGGGIRYDTDRGVGVQAYWEDRNWLGSGEKLRTEAGWWQDTQLVRVSLRKPVFFSRKQTLTAEAWARNEDTIAYAQEAVWLGAGIERMLARYWTASVGVSAEMGSVRDTLSRRQAYNMYSIPVSVNYNSAGNPLDSIKGVRSQVQVRPTMGLYGEDFTAYPVRFDIAGFYPLGLREDERPRVVLAGRMAVGSLLRDEAQKVPASLRWYGGGGGSVRGYAYQSLGPRFHDDPLGGASFVEVSGEARIAVWKEISIVPFIDGGNVYPDMVPSISEDGFQWGTGLGLRYQTPIGPLRLDVATPINPRKEDGPVSFYLSIGQSF